jgi:hypothetical protein
VGPGAGLDRCGKSRPTWIRSPDLPGRSESLYRLRYPGSPGLEVPSLIIGRPPRLTSFLEGAVRPIIFAPA